jgi:hypothetical protein
VWVRVPPRPWFESYKKAELQLQFGFFVGPMAGVDPVGRSATEVEPLGYFGSIKGSAESIL